MVGAINSTTKPSSSQPLVTSPQHRTAAICLIEEDKDTSEIEMVNTAVLISERTAIADGYLAFQNKSLCSAYLHRVLHERSDM